MNKGGAPLGNKNGTKNRVWSLAIEKAVQKKYGKKKTLDALMELAEVLLEKCEDKDIVALKELGDRLEGKPAQSMEVSGPEGEPFKLVFTKDDEAIL